MKILASSSKTVHGFKVVTVVSLMVQLYGLGILLFGSDGPPPGALQGFAQTCLAMGASYLFFYVRRYFPPASQERHILLFLSLGLAFLVLDELGKIDPAYNVVRIIAKLAASIMFAIGLMSDPLKFLPIEPSPATDVSKPFPTKTKGTWYWVLGFLAAFVVSFVPILHAQFVGSKDYPIEDWMKIVWYSGLMVISFVMSFLCPERIWRWGIAVGVALPAAFAARVALDVFQETPYRLDGYFLFVVAFSSVIFGFLPSCVGTATGFMMRKTVEVWRLNK